MHKIPILLIYSRIVFAVFILLLVVFPISNSPQLIVAFMIIALFTDVFDGIIARRLGISTERLRILDSNVDQFFWLLTIGAIFYLQWSFIKLHIYPILLILFLELSAYCLSYIKFKRPIATHSIMAKFWTLSLLTFLIDLVLNAYSHWPYHICIFLGLLSRLEIVAIVLGLKKWTTDVPSILAVAKLNRGLSVKKSKWFNG